MPGTLDILHRIHSGLSAVEVRSRWTSTLDTGVRSRGDTAPGIIGVDLLRRGQVVRDKREPLSVQRVGRQRRRPSDREGSSDGGSHPPPERRGSSFLPGSRVRRRVLRRRGGQVRDWRSSCRGVAEATVRSPTDLLLLWRIGSLDPGGARACGALAGRGTYQGTHRGRALRL